MCRTALCGVEDVLEEADRMHSLILIYRLETYFKDFFKVLYQKENFKMRRILKKYAGEIKGNW